jgi:uncharacterized membrane protein YecN with MAPEG domain
VAPGVDPLASKGSIETSMLRLFFRSSRLLYPRRSAVDRRRHRENNRPVAMPLPISLTFAGVFALLNLWLANRCVRIRLNGPGGVGDLGIPMLRARMRAHANFVEYTPFVLILMALLECAGGSAELLEGAGIVYLLARVLHAFGIERPRFTMQLIGAIGTWVVLLVLAIWAIWTAMHGATPTVH